MRLLAILFPIFIFVSIAKADCESKWVEETPGSHGGHAEYDCKNWEQTVVIDGDDLVIRQNIEPWLSLTNISGVFHLIVRAKSIRIDEPVVIHPADLTLIANSIEFSESGSLDLTPTNLYLVEYKYGDHRFAAQKGKTGANVLIQAKDFIMHGNVSLPRLIVNGGQGEAAPNGFDGEDVPIKPDCRFGTTSTNVPPSYFCRGNDAVAGGAPGSGGDGGRVVLSILNIQNVPLHTASVRPGSSGVEDRKRIGQKAPTTNVLKNAAWSGEQLKFDRFIDGNDAYSDSHSVVPGKPGHIYRRSLAN